MKAARHTPLPLQRPAPAHSSPKLEEVPVRAEECVQTLKRLLLLIVLTFHLSPFTFHLSPLQAQDIHFSQQGENPILMNPAYTGFYDGTGRFGLIYRNQWASVSAPFQTYALTAETALNRSRQRLSGMNLGVVALRDVAGTLNYGSFAARLSLAYYFALDRQGTSILSVGADGGYVGSGFDPTHAEMEDPSEVFEKQRTGYPVFDAGIAWFWQPSGDWQVKTGAAVRNINRPNTSYLGLDDTRLAPLLNLYLRAEWRCWQALSLLPTLMMQLQGQYREAVYGMDLKWYLEEVSRHQVSFATGVAFRHDDALVTHLTMEYDAFVFAFYYDANLSSLSAASNTIGAFELGMVYRLVRDKSVRAIKCPVF